VEVWERCNQLSTIYKYLSGQLTVALRPDELLRAEWVARVSALDLYVHELIAQKMRNIFEGVRPPSKGFLRFSISNDSLLRIRSTASIAEAGAAFDLEIRERISYITYQDPDKIAEGIRLISDVELWNEIAILGGANSSNKQSEAKILKRGLSLIIERRNKIAHEGDLQPGLPRTPWPIDSTDLLHVRDCISSIVDAIEKIV